MSPALLAKVNLLIFLSICELLAAYCYTMERYLHDPDDLLEEAVDDLTHIRYAGISRLNKMFPFSSAFTPATNGDIERDPLFWRAYNQMRIQSDSDTVALAAFNEASLLAETQLKIQLALSDCLALVSAAKKKKVKPMVKKIEFYLAWINEGLVAPADYVENLKGFHSRIKKEMESFENDKQQLIENMPPKKPNCQLITEL